jgi:hypothetical protein
MTFFESSIIRQGRYFMLYLNQDAKVGRILVSYGGSCPAMFAGIEDLYPSLGAHLVA